MDRKFETSRAVTVLIGLAVHRWQKRRQLSPSVIPNDRRKIDIPSGHLIA